GAGRTLLHARLAGACFLCHFNLLVAQRRNGFPVPTAVAILPQLAGGRGTAEGGGGAVTRMNRLASIATRCAPASAGIRPLFDIGLPLLCRALAYARGLMSVPLLFSWNISGTCDSPQAGLVPQKIQRSL